MDAGAAQGLDTPTIADAIRAPEWAAQIAGFTPEVKNAISEIQTIARPGILDRIALDRFALLVAGGRRREERHGSTRFS